MDKQPKYIDADKIIGEIINRIKQIPSPRIDLGGYHTGKKDAYETIIEIVKQECESPDPIPPTIKQGDTRQLLHNTIDVMTDKQACTLATSLGLEVSHD
ncbi:hypothetical protein D3C76_336150 [compost metagenome]